MYQLSSPAGSARSKDAAQQHGGPLTVSPRRPRRRFIAFATDLAVAALSIAAVLILTQPHPATLTVRQLASFSDPGTQGVGSVVFSPDGKTLAAADENGRTYLRDTATGRLVTTLTDPGRNGNGVGASAAFSPNGATLATSDGNDTTFLWDIATGRRIITLTDPVGGAGGAGGGVAGGGKGVMSVAFSPDGTMLATGDQNDRIYLWDMVADRLIATLADPAGGSGIGVTSVAFSPDGTTLAAGDGDGNVYLWDVATGRRIATLIDPEGSWGSVYITSVAFSPDGKDVAAGDTGGYAYVWHDGAKEPDVSVANPGSMALNYSSQGDDDSPGSGNDSVYVAFGPDGTLVAADYFGSDICWWHGSSTFATVTDNSQWISALGLSPDGRTLAVGGNYEGNQSLVLWKVS
jgi:WD40 repeat protein